MLPRLTSRVRIPSPAPQNRPESGTLPSPPRAGFVVFGCGRASSHTASHTLGGSRWPVMAFVEEAERRPKRASHTWIRGFPHSE